MSSSTIVVTRLRNSFNVDPEPHFFCSNSSEIFQPSFLPQCFRASSYMRRSSGLRSRIQNVANKEVRRRTSVWQQRRSIAWQILRHETTFVISHTKSSKFVISPTSRVLSTDHPPNQNFDSLHTVFRHFTHPLSTVHRPPVSDSPWNSKT